MSDIAKSLEKMLNESPVKLSDIQDLQLTDNSHVLNELHQLCEKKLAYRVGVDGYIGYQYLWDSILKDIKMERKVDNIIINERHLSPNIVDKILDSMEKDGIIKKEGDIYRAVLDKLLSKEIVLKFCWGRVDKIKIEDILTHFHFKHFTTISNSRLYSDAFKHCKKIIDQLCDEGALQKFTPNDGDFFSWIDI